MLPPQQHIQRLTRPCTPRQYVPDKRTTDREQQNFCGEPNREAETYKKILAGQQALSERLSAVEKTTNENAIALEKILRAAMSKRVANVPRVSFKTVEDFTDFEKIDDDSYSDLVAHFVFLGRKNPSDCAAEFFRFVFPEDENISAHLTLSGRSSVGGCKLRESRFAQACYDAMDLNKYFPTPNNLEFDNALEKALKSLKTRRWRVNIKQRQAECLQEEDRAEEFRPRQRLRVDLHRFAGSLIDEAQTDCHEMDRLVWPNRDDNQEDCPSSEPAHINDEDDGTQDPEIFSCTADANDVEAVTGIPDDYDGMRYDTICDGSVTNYEFGMFDDPGSCVRRGKILVVPHLEGRGWGPFPLSKFQSVLSFR